MQIIKMNRQGIRGKDVENTSRYKKIGRAASHQQEKNRTTNIKKKENEKMKLKIKQDRKHTT